MAMTVMIIWLVANGLVLNVVSEGNFQIQNSRVISTNLDTLDVSQCEKLSAAAVNPVGFGMVKSLASSSVQATEVRAQLREDDNSYQLNCMFLL